MRCGPVDITREHAMKIFPEGRVDGLEGAEWIISAEDLHLRNCITHVRVFVHCGGDFPDGYDAQTLGITTARWSLRGSCRETDVLFDIAGSVSGSQLTPMCASFRPGTGFRLQLTLDPSWWPPAPAGCDYTLRFRVGLRLSEDLAWNRESRRDL